MPWTDEQRRQYREAKRTIADAERRAGPLTILGLEPNEYGEREPAMYPVTAVPVDQGDDDDDE